mmetsp:Transcript_22305/g.76334  ORF Transcript_22305/g.76334 Transcript_22305/m.76334 type:complete len:359 (-) Transcript_22305:493-1569(-)
MVSKSLPPLLVQPFLLSAKLLLLVECQLVPRLALDRALAVLVVHLVVRPLVLVLLPLLIEVFQVASGLLGNVLPPDLLASDESRLLAVHLHSPHPLPLLRREHLGREARRRQRIEPVHEPWSHPSVEVQELGGGAASHDVGLDPAILRELHAQGPERRDVEAAPPQGLALGDGHGISSGTAARPLLSKLCVVLAHRENPRCQRHAVEPEVVCGTSVAQQPILDRAGHVPLDPMLHVIHEDGALRDAIAGAVLAEAQTRQSLEVDVVLEALAASLDSTDRMALQIHRMEFGEVPEHHGVRVQVDDPLGRHLAVFFADQKLVQVKRREVERRHQLPSRPRCFAKADEGLNAALQLSVVTH